MSVSFNEGITNVRNRIELFRSVSGSLFHLIDLAEAALPEGKGKEKLAFVEKILRDIVTSAGFAIDVFDRVWPLIKTIIDVIVAGRKQTVGGGPGEEQPGGGGTP